MAFYDETLYGRNDDDIDDDADVSYSDGIEDEYDEEEEESLSRGQATEDDMMEDEEEEEERPAVADRIGGSGAMGIEPSASEAAEPARPKAAKKAPAKKKAAAKKKAPAKKKAAKKSAPK